MKITPAECDVQDVRVGDWLVCSDRAARRVIRAGWVAGRRPAGEWVVIVEADATIRDRYGFERPTARVQVLAAS